MKTFFASTIFFVFASAFGMHPVDSALPHAPIHDVHLIALATDGTQHEIVFTPEQVNQFFLLREANQLTTEPGSTEPEMVYCTTDGCPAYETFVNVQRFIACPDLGNPDNFLHSLDYEHVYAVICAAYWLGLDKKQLHDVLKSIDAEILYMFLINGNQSAIFVRTLNESGILDDANRALDHLKSEMRNHCYPQYC